MTHIMQGDACPLIFEVRDEDDALITEGDVDVLEFCVGSIRKTTPVITYADGAWTMPLTQTETLALKPGITPIQCRVKLPSGDVYGWKDCLMVDVEGSISQEVL